MINKMGTFYSILYFGVKDKKSSQTRTKKKKDIFKNSTKKKLYSTSKLESIFSYDVDKARLIYQFALLVKAFEISEDKYLAAITNADFTEIIESAIDKKWRVFVIITLTNKIVTGKSWYRKAAESVGITTDKITSNNPFRKSCDDYNKEYEALIKQIAT